MSRYEEFTLRILDQAATTTGPYLRVAAQLLANEHGTPQNYIREGLIRLAEGDSISLSAWDGERERPHDEWPDANSLFSNTTDNGHVRIRLRSRGWELLFKTPLLLRIGHFSGNLCGA